MYWNFSLTLRHKEQNSVKANGWIGPAKGLVLEILKAAQYRACYTKQSHDWVYCYNWSVSDAEIRTFKQKA